MKAFIITLLLLASGTVQAQTSQCLSWDELVSLWKQPNDDKATAYMEKLGFSLMVSTVTEITFSGDEETMITLVRKEGTDTVTEIRYNTKADSCFAGMEKQMEAGKFVKDFKWEGGSTSSTGYENEMYGAYLYRASTFVQDPSNTSASYIITVYSLAQYRLKKEKYKTNPKLKITEY